MANQFIYDLSDSWNSATTSYNAIKMNVADAASAADAKLINMQINSAPKFTVDKAGNLVAAGAGTFTGTFSVSGAMTAASLTLGTALPLASGGTGAANASTALTNLGVSTFIKSLLDDANGSTALTTLGVSTFMQSVLDDPDQGAARATLGVMPRGIGVVFTASGTWTVPAGTLLTDIFKFTVTGGGGGGSGGVANSIMGSGGAAGNTLIRYVTLLVPGQVVTITIGARGAAGTVAGNGGNGSSTTVALPSYTITAAGGVGATQNGFGGLGAPGANNNADIYLIGGDGQDGAPSTSLFSGGMGGGSFWGSGGKGGRAPSTVQGGFPGQAYGSGGGGGGANVSSAQNGAAGKEGVVMIEWVSQQ